MLLVLGCSHAWGRRRAGDKPRASRTDHRAERAAR
jgi:hypothetical protein